MSTSLGHFSKGLGLFFPCQADSLSLFSSMGGVTQKNIMKCLLNSLPKSFAKMFPVLDPSKDRQNRGRPWRPPRCCRLLLLIDFWLWKVSMCRGQCHQTRRKNDAGARAQNKSPQEGLAFGCLWVRPGPLLAPFATEKCIGKGLETDPSQIRSGPLTGPHFRTLPHGSLQSMLLVKDKGSLGQNLTRK